MLQNNGSVYRSGVPYPLLVPEWVQFHEFCNAMSNHVYVYKCLIPCNNTQNTHVEICNIILWHTEHIEYYMNTVISALKG